MKKLLFSNNSALYGIIVSRMEHRRSVDALAALGSMLCHGAFNTDPFIAS
jgi:hypothetical protein